MRYTRLFQFFIIITINLLILTGAMGKSDNTFSKGKLLFDFQTSAETDNWLIVNDGVMGGLSESKFILSDSNSAVFKGIISLENNGGFSSTRTKPRDYDLADFDGILLRVKGDGKKYQFRIRSEDRFDGMAYRYHFNTEKNKWLTISVPFEECVPVFRGRILNDVEPIDPKRIQQIGFLISDKQAGAFKLEIDWIKAYKK